MRFLFWLRRRKRDNEATERENRRHSPHPEMITTTRDTRHRFARPGPGYLLLGVLYLLGIGTLTIMAIHPDRASGFLAPGAWGTALTMALLSIFLAQHINTISPTPPGRFDPWMAGFLIGSSMVLSFSSYSSCQVAGSGPGDVVVEPLIDSISLFAFSYHDAFSTGNAHCTYLPPLALLTSRLIAVVATFSAVVAVILSMTGRARDVRTVRRASKVQVAIGVDADSADFLASIAREAGKEPRDRRTPLVVLTLLPERPEVERLRAEGALVIKASIEDFDAIHDLFRSTTISRLYLLRADSAVNLRRFDKLTERITRDAPKRPLTAVVGGLIADCVYFVDDLLTWNLRSGTGETTRDSKLVIETAVVRIDNVWEAEDWRAREIGRDDVSVSVVGLHEGTAQALIRPFRHPAHDVLQAKFGEGTEPDGPPLAMWAEAIPEAERDRPESTRDFVICGSSQLTLGLLSALRRSAYEEDQLRKSFDAYLRGSESPGVLDSSRVRVTVHLISPEATFISSSFTARERRRRLLSLPGSDTSPIRIEAHDAEPSLDEIRTVLKELDENQPHTDTPPPVVILTDTSTTESGLLGTMINDLPTPTGAVFEYSDDVWSPVTTDAEGLLQFGLSLGAPMGDSGEASRAIDTLDDARAIAELSHTEYLTRNVGRDDASKEEYVRRPAQRLWDMLDPFYQDDNRRPVREALKVLRSLPRQLGADSKPDTTTQAVSPELDLTPGPAESEALTTWCPEDHEKPEDQVTELTRITQMLVDSSCRIKGRSLDTHEAKAVFLHFARSEHTSWLNVRRHSDPRWELPSLEQRGLTVDGVLPSASGEGTKPDSKPRGKGSLTNPTNKYILDWDEFVSRDAQRASLKKELATLFDSKASLSEEERRAIEDRLDEFIVDPGQVFDQVVTVLHHLDALGYLSAILGESTDTARRPRGRSGGAS